MSFTPSPLAPPPVAPNVWNALGGIWRLTFRRFLVPSQWLILAGLLVVLAVIGYATIGDGNQRRYFLWVAKFYLTFLVPILAFLSGGGAMRDEMKSATVDYVLIRPVRRPVFVIGKFLSHLACLQLCFLCALGVVLAVGVYRQIPALASTLPWLLLAQAITVTAFTALGYFCGACTSRYLVVGLVYAGVVEVGIGRIPTQLNRLSMTHHVRALLDHVCPGMQMAAAPELSALGTVGLLLGFAAIVLACTAVYFSRLELAGARANET